MTRPNLGVEFVKDAAQVGTVMDPSPRRHFYMSGAVSSPVGALAPASRVRASDA
jgi:hypothetical protein